MCSARSLGSSNQATDESRAPKRVGKLLMSMDGKTWPINRTLEPGASAYSDLAVLPDGSILCFYEATSD